MSEAEIKEEWKPITGFEGYSISSRGRVKGPGINRKKETILRPGKSRYANVILCRDNKRHMRLVHRLVLEAFAGPPPTPKHQGAHWNGNRLDNRIANLRWATPKENSRDNVRLGTLSNVSGERHGRAKLTAKQMMRARQEYAKGVSAYQLAKKYGVNASQMQRIVRRERWQHV